MSQGKCYMFPTYFSLFMDVVVRLVQISILSDEKQSYKSKTGKLLRVRIYYVFAHDINCARIGFEEKTKEVSHRVHTIFIATKLKLDMV